MSFEFLKIVDSQAVQDLLDAFCQMTGLHVSVLDEEGDILCSSGMPAICEAYHQKFPEHPPRCYSREVLADAAGGRTIDEGWAEFQCNNGLTDIGSPIKIEGRQVATLLVGPFLARPADPQVFAERADQVGLPQETYLARLAEVPVVPAEKVCEILGFFTNLGKIFTDLAQQSIRHQQARSAADHSENKFRELFTLSADGIVIIDLEGRVLEANPAMCELLGCAGDELLQRSLTDFVIPEHIDRVPARIRSILTAGPVLFETNLLHRQGHHIPVEIRGKAIVFEDCRAILGQVRDLSRRHQAQRALRASEERFRGIFEAAGVGMVLSARDGHFLQVNPEFCRFLGYSEEELLSKTVEEVTYPADRQHSMQLLQEAQHGKRSIVNLEKRYLHKNGSPVWGRLTAVNRISETEHTLVSVAMIQDITEQKLARQAVEASEATLKGILVAAPMSIGLIRQRVISWVNRWMIDETGFAEEELIGQSARLLYETEAEFERVGKIKYAELSQGRMAEVQTRMRCKDGRLIEVLLRAVPLDPVNLDEGVIFTASNITDLIRAETELRKALDSTATAHQQINAILRSVTAGLIVVDRAGLVQLINPAAEKLLACQAFAAVGLPVAEILADAEFLARIRLALAGDEKPAAIELKSAQRESRPGLYLQIKVTSLKEAGGGVRGAVAILRDVTREHEINQMKDDFISTAAHELRTPMTSILGYTELMLERIECLEKGQLREFLQIVFDRSEALSQIVSDMLDLSRVQSGRLISLEKTPGRLAELLQQIVPSYEHNDNGCQILINVDEGLPVSWFDPHKMTQVFDNLISNAVKFSPDGGSVAVNLENDSGGTLVTVKDQGLGMSAEQKERVFEKFYRADYTNTAISGLGLGMSLVRSIVEGHGGSIWVESEVGSGTTVSFTVPGVAPGGEGV